MDKILELELTSNDPAEISQLLDQYIEALTSQNTSNYDYDEKGD